jgi:hypothetical protein
MADPIEAGVHAWLAAQPAIVSQVGKRIYPSTIPQSAQGDAINYAREDTEDIFTLGGALPDSATLTVLCQSNASDLAALALATLIKGVEPSPGVPAVPGLNGYRGPLGAYQAQLVRVSGPRLEFLNDPAGGEGGTHVAALTVKILI